jgi:hypothetical protein
MAGIDGFALNIGPSDSWTGTQLYYAYGEAVRLGSFSLFLSFEYVQHKPEMTWTGYAPYTQDDSNWRLTLIWLAWRLDVGRSPMWLI